MVAKFKKSGKDSYQNILFSLLIGIFFFGTIGFLITSNLKINQKRGESLDRIESLKKEIQVLEEKNQQLKTGILETEKESFWEEKAREQGYKKPGEEPVVVLPAEEKPTSTEKEKGFLGKILDPVRNFFSGL